MSEQYKSSNYINMGNLSKIRTVGDLKEFINMNMHLSEEEIYDNIKDLMPIGIDIDTIGYIKNSIRKIKRKKKIELLLKNESVDNK
jgi:hypothetical protein